MKSDQLTAQIDHLLGINADVDSEHALTVYAGGLSLCALVYGANAAQVRSLEQRRPPPGNWIAESSAATSARAALLSLRAEITFGLVGDLRRAVAGELLADFLQLAREALAAGHVGADNVAAVLVAAAYEDTIRRLGERAGVTGRPDLQSVLTSLKKASVLQGPQISIAQSYLKFRNDALHADWSQIERTGTKSVLAFIDEMLLKHFS